MSNFKIRKTGGDLSSLPEYNQYGNGKYNAFHPEYAPKSVGGTFSASDIASKESKGNCTWYVFGRYQETHGERVEFAKRQGNAGEWKPDTQTASVGSIVIFTDSQYGHVAFVEKIEGGNIILSESAYSTRGNDFLFKYGRTVDEVCGVWGMKVKGYINPPKPSTSYDEENQEKAENGYIIVTHASGLNVRKQSSTTGAIARVMAKGERYDYKAYIDINGYRWVTDGSTFVARRSLDNKQVFASAHFANEKPVTPPKPVEPVKPPVQNRVGNILVVTQKDFKKPKFTAYQDKACTIPLAPWTMANYNHDLTFYITEDNDPIFKCVQWSKTPMGGIDHVYIKWESGIRFDNA